MTAPLALSQIMRMAHALNGRHHIGLSYCLRMAWQFAKGKSFVAETAYLDGTRSLIFGDSYGEVRAARIAENHAFIARGIKPIGSSECNLAPYLPAPVESPKPSKLAQPSKRIHRQDGAEHQERTAA